MSFSFLCLVVLLTSAPASGSLAEADQSADLLDGVSSTGTRTVETYHMPDGLTPLHVSDPEGALSVPTSQGEQRRTTGLYYWSLNQSSSTSGCSLGGDVAGTWRGTSGGTWRGRSLLGRFLLFVKMRMIPVPAFRYPASWEAR